jgi:hypothetical protein
LSASSLGRFIRLKGRLLSIEDAPVELLERRENPLHLSKSNHSLAARNLLVDRVILALY